MAAMDSQTRADLLEIIDDRASQRATIITSQLPIEHWHEWIGDQTMADAMLDRLMQNHHRFTLTGESLRKKSPPAKASTDHYSTTVRDLLVQKIQFQRGQNSRKSTPA